MSNTNLTFNEIVHQRYATKKFTGEKLPVDKVDALLEIIRMSASSFGLQPWKIKVVSDQETKDKLQAASWNQPQIGTASHVLVLCAYANVEILIDMYLQQQLQNGASKEQLLPYAEMMRGFVARMTPEQQLNWAQKQTYIAMGNAINGAKSLGFDSCPMEGFNPEEYSKILGLSKNLIPTIVVPIGIAADTPRPKSRFPLKDILA